VAVNLGGLWRAVREDRAGGSANDPFGHAAAQKQTNQAGPAARRENDQVAPEPPGNARNLIGRIAIYHQSVGCHPGLAKLIAGTAEVPLSLRAPHFVGANPSNAGDLWRRVDGDRRVHVEKHQRRSVAASQTRRSLYPDVRHGGEIGRAQNAPILAGPVPPVASSDHRPRFLRDAMRDPSPGEHTSAPPQSPFPDTACRVPPTLAKPQLPLIS